MLASVLGIICVLACGFMIYVLAQFHREARRPKTVKCNQRGTKPSASPRERFHVIEGAGRQSAPTKYPRASRSISGAAAVLLALTFTCGRVSAQSVSSEVRGVTRYANGLPFPEAQVSVRSVEEKSDRKIVSGADGAFVIDNLKPGRYQLTAYKNGLVSPSLISVELAAGQSLRFDMTLCDPLPAASGSDLGMPPSSKPAEMTESEKYLLSVIGRLENRITQLEARLGAKSNETASVESGEGSQLSMGTQPPNPSGGSLLAALPSTKGDSKPSQATSAKPGKKPAAEPFAFGDFTWLNGNSRTKESPLDTKLFTGEFRFDTSYIYDFNHPKDHTLGGTSESGRTGEIQLQQLGIGGDFHYQNVRGRFMTQFGMYSTMTPRNDASPSTGQWNLDNAYRYISEAYGGYHFDVMHGINVDAGIFMSYVGLFSYYNFDNWAYQPSYVSSNTPWFFNGVRVQIYPTEHLKIEPWFVNGWQSYGKFNKRPGFGMQVLWRPNSWLSILGNQYFLGTDTLGNGSRTRYHTDDSIEVKYYDKPERLLDKAAFSLTLDAGCETGGGVSCWGNRAGGPKQSFLGFMLYNRFWFNKDMFGLTLGGGKMNNPGRYLVLMPPINGATAASGTPYFTANPGDPFKAWDASITFDYMPKQFVTFRWEFDHRAANVPYFTGPGGFTPPGGNTGAPGSFVPGFVPDLRKIENRFNLALLVKF